MGIDSVWSFITFNDRSWFNLYSKKTRQLIHQYAEVAAVAILSRPRPGLLVRGLMMSGQAMGVRHYLEDNVGRVMQNVDEGCLAEKRHLGNLLA